MCVDRDNDLGRKAKVRGPIVGRENNLSAAQKLILADPSESDANTMFAAIKKLQEAKKHYKNAEIVTITGEGKIGLKADKEINRQLDVLTKQYKIEGWIVVTDGAEDNQVMPLLQSRAKIISTEQVIIKQAQAVESTFYTIKEALKDPGIARLALGVPGIILIAVFAFGSASLQIIALIAGAYLLLKGFGIEDRIFGFIRTLSESFSEQKVASFVFYVIAIILPLIGLWLAYLQLMSAEFIDISIDIASALRAFYPLAMFGALSFIMGKAVEAYSTKKAYLIGNRIVQGVSVICVWAIIDGGTLVFLRQAELSWVPATIMLSFILIVASIRIGRIFDVRDRVSKIFIGLNAMDEEGNYLGKIISADKKKQTILIQEPKTQKTIEKQRKQFKLINGIVIINS